MTIETGGLEVELAVIKANTDNQCMMELDFWLSMCHHQCSFGENLHWATGGDSFMKNRAHAICNMLTEIVVVLAGCQMLTSGQVKGCKLMDNGGLVVFPELKGTNHGLQFKRWFNKSEDMFLFW